MKDRKVLKFLFDLILWSISIPLAYTIRLEEQIISHTNDVSLLFVFNLPLIVILIYFFGFYRQSWHNTSIPDILNLVKGIGLHFLILITAAILSSSLIFMPVSIPLISSAIALILLFSIRIVARINYEYNTKIATNKSKEPVKRVLIVGAGDAGNLLLREILRHPFVKMDPIGFLDDDVRKKKERFMGMPVLGYVRELPKIVAAKKIDLVLIAMPTAPGKAIRKVAEMAKLANVDFKIMPGIYEIISGKFNISQLRNVDVQDLLRREHVNLDSESISKYIKDKVILVTGAGGSIGSELVRQISKSNPKQILLIGRGENSIYKIESECLQLFPSINVVSIIVDVKDIESLNTVFKKYSPQVVFHTAAHKHVSLMENNPAQAIFNNIGGTQNMVNMALKYSVERFVNISSDKSVNPTSVMGASKRVAEFIVEWASYHADKGQEFVSVRFGNVLGSRGSVVPLFKQQIKNGGPITITHPDMTRYFMTIPEASQLVIQAGALGGNGSVYILDMGEPVKIVDLANDLIKLSGLTPSEDIEIVYTGIKPGEKMFEELLTDEESTTATRHKKIFAAKTSGLPKDSFEELLEELFKNAHKQDSMAIKEQLKVIIPTYAFDNQKIKL